MFSIIDRFDKATPVQILMEFPQFISQMYRDTVSMYLSWNSIFLDA
eukprot:COSAG02_NODE_1466_length_12483_cov_37.157703_1_plen_46_part_00